jgi:hypothetical protein
MRASILATVAGMVTTLLLGAGGCRGCLDIDDYTLVPGPPPDAGTGGASSSSGTGGTDACQAPGDARGTVMMASVVGAGESPADGCALAGAQEGDIDLLALDPGSGSCLARGRIYALAGGSVAARPQVMHRLDDRMVVGAGFAGSAVLPGACGGPATTLTVEAPAEATQAMFVASLQATGGGFCTLWASTAWTSEPGSDFGIARVRMDEQGVVAAVGGLGAGTVFFEGGPVEGLRGGPFFARWKADGALSAPPAGELVTLRALADGPGATATGVGQRDGQWWATGTLQHESPSCHGCQGTSHVMDAAGSCPAPGSGGAGGAGGTGGAGGSGGNGGGPATGGAGGAGADARNAFLWRPSERDGECGALETFGADGDPLDSQIGFDLAPANAGCGTYWGGVAGRSVWRLVGDRPETALYESGGMAVDGFLARLGASSACAGGEAPWSLRLVPSELDAQAVAERITGKRCTAGAVAAVTAPGTGSLAAVRCSGSDGSCEAPASIPLASGTPQQLALLATRDDGTLDWSVAFGPLAEAAGATPAAPADGSLRMVGITDFGCEPLVDGAGAGRWMVALQPQGFGGEAICAWARRFGP